MGEYTAADIITFIGVPLAVLGVMPLLWNMAKAFIIRRHLVKALPSKIRPYFSIIMDPASGTVSVVYPDLYLNAGSLLGYETLSLDPVIEAAEEVPPEDWHKQHFEEASGTRGRIRRWIHGPEKTGYNFEYSESGPAASWMGLLYHGVIPNREHRALLGRITVESDLHCPPPLVCCKWPIFVNLAMGLGFYLCDKRGRCHDGVDKLRDALLNQTKISTALTLRNVQGEVLMHVIPTTTGNVARVRNGPLGFSLHRMLAWHNVMLTGLDTAPELVALPSLERFAPDEILSLSTEGIVRWRQSPSGDKVLSAQPGEPYRLDIHTTNWRPDTFEHCLTWTIYAEMSHQDNAGPLPTNQAFLIWQDMSIVWLGRRERTALYQQLDELIGDTALLNKTKKYLEECWDTPIFSPGTVAPQNSPYHGLLDIKPLTDPATFRERLKEKGGGSYAGARRNSNRLGSKYDGSFHETRPNLWAHLQNHDVGRAIVNRYDPRLDRRTRTDDVIRPGSLEELAAHLLIAAAIFKAWPRADWFLHWTDVGDDGRVHYRTYNDDPMGSVLKGGSKSEDLATMGVMYLS
ncbi:hypothetical protein QBC39DRAFT_381405 [Podospora conica]|nr:hypothetical protein QBC39DRAFT_381405 [Schizothecium conicum]